MGDEVTRAVHVLLLSGESVCQSCILVNVYLQVQWPNVPTTS